MREGYELRLERDKSANLLVLHVKDTRTGRRSEVRGKLGYETTGYDANDKLHQLLDKIGKASNISDLMNGEVVTINPKHPQGTSATKAASAITAETILEKLGEIAPNTEIYVDMDGVLADFFGEWAKAMGKKSFRDIEDPEAAIGKIKDIKDFWLNLPVLPQAKQLLTLIKKVKGKYKICTSPLADDPRSEPHKREWVKKNLAFFPPEEVIVTHNKPQFATQKDGTPNILIDDYGVNINAWEEAGGIGFKYKDHKFDRTAKDIKQHMQEPVGEGELLDKPTPSIDQLAKRHGVDRSHIIDQVKMGMKAELEHTSKKDVALEIALDHVLEDPNYYTNLKFIENFADGKKKGKVYNESTDLNSLRKFVRSQREAPDQVLYQMMMAPDTYGHSASNFVRSWYEKTKEENGLNDIDSALEIMVDELGLNENFADGKKKGKSRPGRVKRAGASCNGSVTSLRKRAKNSSGEKARMYHWCANMKGGKKK